MTLKLKLLRSQQKIRISKLCPCQLSARFFILSYNDPLGNAVAFVKRSNVIGKFLYVSFSLSSGWQCTLHL